MTHTKPLGTAGSSSPATVPLTRPQVPLLPPQAEGMPLKETAATKSTGKRDKDGKGGKKGQENKGSKGSKSDPSGEPSGGLGQTAWPPCMALSSLVDVVATGDISQVHADYDVLNALLRLWKTHQCFFEVYRIQGTIEEFFGGKA